MIISCPITVGTAMLLTAFATGIFSNIWMFLDSTIIISPVCMISALCHAFSKTGLTEP